MNLPHFCTLEFDVIILKRHSRKDLSLPFLVGVHARISFPSFSCSLYFFSHAVWGSPNWADMMHQILFGNNCVRLIIILYSSFSYMNMNLAAEAEEWNLFERISLKNTHFRNGHIFNCSQQVLWHRLDLDVTFQKEHSLDIAKTLVICNEMNLRNRLQNFQWLLFARMSQFPGTTHLQKRYLFQVINIFPISAF